MRSKHKYERAFEDFVDSEFKTETHRSNKKCSGLKTSGGWVYFNLQDLEKFELIVDHSLSNMRTDVLSAFGVLSKNPQLSSAYSKFQNKHFSDDGNQHSGVCWEFSSADALEDALRKLERTFK